MVFFSTASMRGLLLASLLAVTLLTSMAGSSPASAASGDPTRPERFAAARSWGYQLQNVDPKRLAEAPYDVLVIDYLSYKEDAPLTAAEVQAMQRVPDGRRRIVLAYMSIGEAETYRYYWEWKWGGSWLGSVLSLIYAPAWLGGENAEWGGNYAVRYWEDGWQRIILGNGGYLDRIVAAGFDGVYLDKVDASIERITKGRPTAKDDMRNFVARIAERGRRLSPGFLIVPQNGEELLDSPAYVALIDGLAKEDLLFGEFKNGVANPPDVIARRTAMLAPLLAARKPILAVEYIDDANVIRVARETLTALGCVPHFAHRDLAAMRFTDTPDAAGSSDRKSRRRWFRSASN